MSEPKNKTADWLCYSGNGGNVIYINPDRNMVVAVASRFLPRVNDRIELIREYIEPTFL